MCCACMLVPGFPHEKKRKSRKSHEMKLNKLIKKKSKKLRKNFPIFKLENKNERMKCWRFTVFFKNLNIKKCSLISCNWCVVERKLLFLIYYDVKIIHTHHAVIYYLRRAFIEFMNSTAASNAASFEPQISASAFC